MDNQNIFSNPLFLMNQVNEKMDTESNLLICSNEETNEDTSKVSLFEDFEIDSIVGGWKEFNEPNINKSMLN